MIWSGLETYLLFNRKRIHFAKAVRHHRSSRVISIVWFLFLVKLSVKYCACLVCASTNLCVACSFNMLHFCNSERHEVSECVPYNRIWWIVSEIGPSQFAFTTPLMQQSITDIQIDAQQKVWNCFTESIQISQQNRKRSCTIGGCIVFVTRQNVRKYIEIRYNYIL